MVVAGAPVLALLLHRRPARPAPRRPGRCPGLRGAPAEGRHLPGSALGLGNLGYAVVVGFLVVHLDDRGARGAVALTAFSVAVLVGRLVVVPLTARIGILRTLPYGLSPWPPASSSSARRAAPRRRRAAAVVGLGYCLPFPALATLVAGRVGDSSAARRSAR